MAKCEWQVQDGLDSQHCGAKHSTSLRTSVLSHTSTYVLTWARPVRRSGVWVAALGVISRFLFDWLYQIWTLGGSNASCFVSNSISKTQKVFFLPFFHNEGFGEYIYMYPIKPLSSSFWRHFWNERIKSFVSLIISRKKIISPFSDIVWYKSNLSKFALMLVFDLVWLVRWCLTVIKLFHSGSIALPFIQYMPTAFFTFVMCI